MTIDELTTAERKTQSSVYTFLECFLKTDNKEKNLG